MISESLEQAVRELAYSKWELAGCPAGDGIHFWLEAEREVRGAGSTQSVNTPVACEKNLQALVADVVNPPLKLAKPSGGSRRRAS